jgi:hypothetical protein
MDYRKYIRRYIAPILALLILCSSIGVSSYERFCSCSGQEYHSLFVQSQSDCCKKVHSQKAEKKHSCCSKKQSPCEKPSNEKEPNKKDNCCDTDVEFLALDLDATLDLSSDIESSNSLSFIPFQSPTLKLKAKASLAFEYEEENRKSFQAQAPPPLRTNERLQSLQIMRC